MSLYNPNNMVPIFFFILKLLLKNVTSMKQMIKSAVEYKRLHDAQFFLFLVKWLTATTYKIFMVFIAILLSKQ